MVILIVLRDLHTLELKAKCPKDHTRGGSSGYSECSKNLVMLRLGATFIRHVLRTYGTLELEAVVTLNVLRIYITLWEAKVTRSATMIQPVLLGLSDKGQLLTVTVSPEPTFIIESGSFRNESLKCVISLRVHMEAAATGGSSSTKDNSDRTLKAAVLTLQPDTTLLSFRLVSTLVPVATLPAILPFCLVWTRVGKKC